MPRAIGYRRVSTDEQFASGAGLGAQLQAQREWCARNGYDLVGPFDEDEGLPGSTPMEKCPALTEAVNSLEKGDVLLVYKRDRLARNRLKVLVLEGYLKKQKCRLVSTQGEGTASDDPDDPTDRLLAGIIDLFAEYEALLIGWRTKRGLAVKKARGERTGRIPYGFDCVDDGRRSKVKEKVLKGQKVTMGGLPVSLVPNEAEQRVLEHIKAWRKDGHTYDQITWFLNRNGIKTKTGKPWQRGSVRWLCVTRGYDKDPDYAPVPAPVPALSG